jgi:hypothetical protein
MVRSTIQRSGSTTNLPTSDRFTICAPIWRRPAAVPLELLQPVATVGVKLQQEWKQTEQRAHQQHTSVAVLNVRSMRDGREWQALGVYQGMPVLAFDFLAGILAIQPPFFGARYALAGDNRGRWAGLLAGQIVTLYIERVVGPAQRAVIVGAALIVIYRATRRQILG